MKIALITTIITIPLLLIFIFAIIYLFRLVVKALKKYLRSNEIKEEQSPIRKTLGSNIKEHRLRCKMTQEFVAERLGVSRQAVSKWETGESDPNTTNLFALAELFGITAEDLLKDVIKA